MMLGLLTIAAALVAVLHQVPADTTLPGVLPPGGALGWGGSVLIGLGAAFGTKLIAGAGSWVDRQLGSVDDAIRKGIGPALPVVATAWAIGLPILANKLGITNLPSADILANAPVSAIAGIALREAGRRWLLPLVKKGS